MTSSIPKSRLPNKNQAFSPSDNDFISRNICFIVGLTCIAGFMVDLLVLGTPPDPFALEWRIGFLQQMGDRSIVFLFGVALILYSIFDNRRIKRPLALLCLGLGVAFLLSSLLIIRDSLTLKDQAFRTISTQEEQLQTRIEESRASGELPADISLEQIQQASQEITTQAQQAKQSTSQGITKAGMSSLGNLVVVGMGLIGLGRIGVKRG